MSEELKEKTIDILKERTNNDRKAGNNEKK